jgi:hypothetical protein
MRQQTYGTVFYPPLTKTIRSFIVTLTDIKDAIKKSGKEKEWKNIRRNTTNETSDRKSDEKLKKVRK